MREDAVDLPRGLGGGSAVAIMAKGGSDRDCLRTIHNGGTSEGKAGQSLTDRKRVGGRLIKCPSLWVKEDRRHVKYVSTYLRSGGVLHSGLCQAKPTLFLSALLLNLVVGHESNRQ